MRGGQIIKLETERGNNMGTPHLTLHQPFRSRHIRRHIHTHGVAIHFHHSDGNAVFQRATAPVSPPPPAVKLETSPGFTTFLADSRKCQNASKKETPPTV